MLTNLLAQATTTLPILPDPSLSPITVSDQAALGIFGGLFSFFAVVGLISLIIWLWALIDVIRREFTKPEDKTLWLVVVIVGFVIGLAPIAAIVYLIVGRPKGTIPVSKNNTPATPAA